MARSFDDRLPAPKDRQPVDPSILGPDLGEKGANISDKQVRRLEGRKVSATIELGPVRELYPSSPKRRIAISWWIMAVYIGTLGYDFTVSEPSAVVEHFRTLSERYARATGST